MNFGAREADIMSEFTSAGRRRGLVEVPPFTSPLTDFQQQIISSEFDPSSVTLNNITQNYVMIKNFVVEGIQEI